MALPPFPKPATIITENIKLPVFDELSKEQRQGFEALKQRQRGELHALQKKQLDEFEGRQESKLEALQRMEEEDREASMATFKKGRHGILSHPVAAGEDQGVRSIQWWLVVATGPEGEEVQEEDRPGEKKSSVSSVLFCFFSCRVDLPCLYPSISRARFGGLSPSQQPKEYIRCYTTTPAKHCLSPSNGVHRSPEFQRY
jgi:hypothetical protein